MKSPSKKSGGYAFGSKPTSPDARQLIPDDEERTPNAINQTNFATGTGASYLLAKNPTLMNMSAYNSRMGTTTLPSITTSVQQAMKIQKDGQFTIN